MGEGGGGGGDGADGRVKSVRFDPGFIDPGFNLWRMCFAFFVATGSFFLGQQDVMPQAVRGSPILFVLAFAPFALMLFWLVRVRFSKTIGGLQLLGAASGTPTGTLRHDRGPSDLELGRSERLALNHARSGEQADVQPGPADRLGRPCRTTAEGR